MPPEFERAMKAKYRAGAIRLIRGEGYMTHRDLLRRLRDLPDAVLDQRVLVFKDTGDLGEPVRLQPAYGFGTVEEMCHVDGEVARETRGPDFAHHPEQLILLVDGAPFDKHGNTWHTLEDGGLRGNLDGKLRPFGGKDVAVAEPDSWEVYGRMAYVRWRRELESAVPVSHDEASGEWGDLDERSREAWRGFAKSSAVMAYPVLAGKTEPRGGP